MAKTYLSTVKYVIKTSFTIEGIVDKHDIIGAIFGQSEGLIGEEMDLKELQKNGKLGRIEVETQTKSGKTVGELTIPSSLDRVQTSILAAAIESVDKVGPCSSIFQTTSIEDARQEKRKVVTERARELLMRMKTDIPETQELTEQIREDTRTADIREIGLEKVPVGPEARESPELILVEGRADVINLVKHGIKNVAGIGGAKVTRTVVEIAKGKSVTIFVDGDRGGDIIARQLSRAIKIEFVARAPDGKEVEELTLKEILGSLRKKVEIGEAFSFRREVNGFLEAGEPESGFPRRWNDERNQRSRPWEERRPGERGGRSRERGRSRPGFRSNDRNGFRPRFRSGERDGFRQRRGFGERREFPQRQEPFEKREMPIKPNDLGEFSQAMQELEGSLKARLLDEKMQTLKELNVRDLLKEIEKHKNVEAIILDGIVTKRLLDEAEKAGVKHVVGVKKGRVQETGTMKVSTLY